MCIALDGTIQVVVVTGQLLRYPSFNGNGQ